MFALSFLDEEMFGGGWELVEVSDWYFEVLVGIVETFRGVGIGVGFVIGGVKRHGRDESRI